MTLHRGSNGRLHAVGRYGDVMTTQLSTETDVEFMRRAAQLEDREGEKAE